MRKAGKEVTLRILTNLNNGCIYITRSVITQFFPVDHDDRVIMEFKINWLIAKKTKSSNFRKGHD